MTTSPLPGCPVCARPATLLYPATTDDRDRLHRPEQFVCTSLEVSDHGDIFQCSSCQLGFIAPTPSPAELSRLYGGGQDPDYLAQESGRRATWERVVRKTIGPGTGRQLLDVGAHTGIFADVAAKNGWAVTGVEPNDWARSIASQQFGVTSRRSIDELGHARYDVVTMFDVIEHMTDPLAELQRLHRLLNPGGRLILTTPDLGSPVARLLRSRWYCIRQQHLFYFNPTSIRTVLERSGFKLVSLQRYHRTFSIGYWLNRLATFLRFRWLAHRVARWSRLVTIPTNDEMLIVAERL
ncbi:MAG: class I SAM-dependent methyltransferase [Candidatus Kerfeldbacteria bacterium]|nr:class I SAM-dependent methyltransferase [Candidatus Kerfeldbacteria bacterium]